MPRFSTYEYENKIKEQKRRMSYLIQNYKELKSIFPYLKFYAKYTKNEKAKINISINLEACEIMYNDAVRTLKSTRKIKLSEYEEINDTLLELMTILQKYYKNLSLNGNVNDSGINPLDL